MPDRSIRKPNLLNISLVNLCLNDGKCTLSRTHIFLEENT